MMMKVESGIHRERSNSDRGKNPKSHLPGRLDLATLICYSNDETQPRIEEMYRSGATNFPRHRKILSPNGYG